MVNNNIPASAYTVFVRIPFMAAPHRLPRFRSCGRPVRLRGGVGRGQNIRWKANSAGDR